MRRNVIETVMGAVVLVVAGMFLFFAYSGSTVRTVGGYELVARFERVDGIAVGSDVRISGIKVGTVTDNSLDPKSYLAIVKMSIKPTVQVPADTVAEIATEGLLGGRYLALVPGGDDQMLKPGGVIKFTQAPVDLTTLLGKFVFSAADSASKKSEQPK
ncbi:MAG: outer membrane lipid asymmetry maintenance protein MlaD [Alphaproteobacteria bacterium]|nr:outer membrane lipid asymmetry maintenance protein MlaD [Alphaproteobacteria bacterium]